MLVKPASQASAGFTVVELMVVLTVMAVLAAIAAPSFLESIARGRLKSVAETALGQLYAAKAESLRTGKPVHFSVQPGAAGCYGFNVGAPCACDAAAATQCGLYRSEFAASPSVSLASTSVPGGQGMVEPVRGTVQGAGALTFRNTRGQELSVGMTRVGRPYICTPAGVGQVTGYGAC